VSGSKPSGKRHVGSSLIPEETLEVMRAGRSNHAYRTVPIDQIVPNPEQPRQRFSDEGLEALTESIRIHGVLSPLLVCRREGRYVLIAGERRLRSCALAGVMEVPVVLKDTATAQEQLELALVENLVREDLDPIEEGKGYARLMETYGYTQEEIASRVGKNRSTIANAIRLLGLPPFVREALLQKVLSAGHARALLPLGDSARCKRVFATVLRESLSVRATERKVREAMKRPSRAQASHPTRDEIQATRTSGLLEGLLGTQVQVRPRKDGGGRIVIDYASEEQLCELVEQMRPERTKE